VGKSEIDDDEMALVVEKNIRGLKVAVDYSS
jgi:hypothetical protein